jgi:hypothetical protein
MVGCKNYTGDFTIFPDFHIINNAITEYERTVDVIPISYSLDFAITDGGETQLIEINDGFALGSYGLNSIYYCKFIRDRWNQLINTKN